jgi:hypothetical protein
MIEILCEAIFDHYSNHLSIILCDFIVRCCSLCLRFLVCTCFLYRWSLSSPRSLCDGVRCGFLCSLSQFPLSIGRLSGFWVPGCSEPSSASVDLVWLALHFLGTGICGAFVSTYEAPPSAIYPGTSMGMVGILHSLGHSLMIMLISPSVTQ